MPRLYPALDLVWPTAPSEERIARLLVELDDESLTAVEERTTSTRLFFASAEGRRRAADRLLTHPELGIETVDVSDEDWAERSQASLGAVRVGPLVVAPPWAAPRVQPGDLLVIIEPSTGFGTGHHATTRLCLQMLQEAPVTGRTVLDVGTGSGVLAIAAAKLGASRVLAIDCDPDALSAARDNVASNGVSDLVTVIESDVGAGFSRPDSQPDSFDLVLANLTGTALVRHAAALAARLSRGGSLITSGYGVLEERDVTAAFAGRALRPSSRAEEDGWVATAFGLQKLQPPS